MVAISVILSIFVCGGLWIAGRLFFDWLEKDKSASFRNLCDKIIVGLIAAPIALLYYGMIFAIVAGIIAIVAFVIYQMMGR
jgi:hypothetical protein